jgi:Ca-activated chloride channel family protein
MVWKTGLLAMASLAGAVQLLAQAVEIQPVSVRRGSPEVMSRALIRADSNLVLVPVHVTNRAGTTIDGLAENAFTVLEDKVRRPIVSFGNEDVPCSVGVILDLSGSMSGRIRVAANVLHSFLETANPADESFLLTVSSKPQIVSGFTSDFGLLESKLVTAEPGGATALVDTIMLGLDRMKAGRLPHKALLVVSDGMDNHSRYSAPELIRRVEEADVQIYTIRVETWALTKKPIELTEERNGDAFLRDLAEHSGGLHSSVRDFNEAPGIAARLSQAIRDQYVIGYRPAANDDSGKWRAIQVKVDMPQTRVSARTGYYSR